MKVCQAMASGLEGCCRQKEVVGRATKKAIDQLALSTPFLADSKTTSIKKIKEIWSNFKATPQELNLPFAPIQPIIYLENENRPQPKKDRNLDKGMAVTVGRLRKDTVFDIKFVSLSHNTIRGAAGGGILNAELLKEKGFFNLGA